MEAPTHNNIIGVFSAMESDAIVVHQERCAKVRNRLVSCLKCADACTSGCISLVEGELSIDASKCVGCGTCATVCPTCALETRNPTDSELLRECLRVRVGNEVAVACSQMLAACGDLVARDKVAHVVCAGRVDESLAISLAGAGVERVHVVCGACGKCAQVHGEATAELVASTANDLLKAWGSSAGVLVEHAVPEFALADGADASELAATVEGYFETPRSCAPICGEDAAGAKDCETPALSEEELRRMHKEHFRQLVRVMKDGTLPHFIPDRRERVLDGLAALGEPATDKVEVRLWGRVEIDVEKCVSCRACATFCPTGAIRKFGDMEGEFGIDHYPGDCVKCGSCRDICRVGAIAIKDDVSPASLLDGEVHRVIMRPPAAKLGDSHQILNVMRLRIPGTNIFER